jgi:hypothetical protein
MVRALQRRSVVPGAIDRLLKKSRRGRAAISSTKR